jgi:hypothetical protein
MPKSNQNPYGNAVAGQTHRYIRLDLGAADNAVIRLPASCDYVGVMYVEAATELEVRGPISNEAWAEIIDDDEEVEVDSDFSVDLAAESSVPGQTVAGNSILVLHTEAADLGEVILVIEANIGATVEVFQYEDD